jgi:HEPN domain-containing protein
MKQTATNYLIDQLELKVMAHHLPWVAEILDKAREMEKEQIIQAYENLNYDDGKEYYNETHGIED